MEKDQIKVAQLSDLHFLDDESSLVQGFSPYENLSTIVEKRLLMQYDYLFLSGDLSENGSIKSYELIRSVLDKLEIPTYCVPGNHDNKDHMISVFSESNNIHIRSALSFLNWEVLFLDTTVLNEMFGLLSEETLKKLHCNIKESSADNIAIVMHHHPYNSGVSHFDQVNLKNFSELQKIIRNTKVRLVTFGHVHNYYSMMFDSILYESAPATVFQLEQQGTDLAIDGRYGYKELTFTADGVTSNCVWATRYP